MEDLGAMATHIREVRTVSGGLDVISLEDMWTTAEELRGRVETINRMVASLREGGE